MMRPPSLHALIFQFPLGLALAWDPSGDEEHAYVGCPVVLLTGTLGHHLITN